jgi:hypothetical protein
LRVRYLVASLEGDTVDNARAARETARPGKIEQFFPEALTGPVYQQLHRQPPWTKLRGMLRHFVPFR